MVSEVRQKKLSHKLSMKVTASKCVPTLESRRMCLVSLGSFSVDHIAFQRPAGKQTMLCYAKSLQSCPTV